MSALYLQGISLVRRNSEWHHFDPLGTAQVITNGSAQVVSNNVYDVFGVLRYEQGTAQTPWISQLVRHEAEGLTSVASGQWFWLPSRFVWLATNASLSGDRAVGRTLAPLGWSGWLRPIVGPACIGCLGGFAAPLLALIFDCGWPNPFNPDWRQCVTDAWNAFWEACAQDAVCTVLAGLCGYACYKFGDISTEKPDEQKPTKPRPKKPKVTCESLTRQ